MEKKLSNRVIIIDPPSGWRYGFPKIIPDEVFLGSIETFIQWFRDQGYPEWLIQDGNLNHYRFWYAEVDENGKVVS